MRAAQTQSSTWKLGVRVDLGFDTRERAQSEVLMVNPRWVRSMVCMSSVNWDSLYQKWSRSTLKS